VCWTRARVQIAASTLSGNSLRQTVHTHCASVHQAAKLAADLLRVARVTAGLAERNGNLPPGLWLTWPAGWLQRPWNSSGTLRSVIEYGLPTTFIPTGSKRSHREFTVILAKRGCESRSLDDSYDPGASSWDHYLRPWSRKGTRRTVSQDWNGVASQNLRPRLFDSLSCGFMSQSTRKKTKPNTTKARIHQSKEMYYNTNTHTHTHPFNDPFSGTTRVSRYQKGKKIWILLKQETVSTE